mmetsp:Transcript_20465/g.53243  ORF Transcript_20465/g.53243 Transcript_20465/m.53243 type:complete len:314 (-) Transcript_20465:106-1047(-)
MGKLRSAAVVNREHVNLRTERDPHYRVGVRPRRHEGKRSTVEVKHDPVAVLERGRHQRLWVGGPLGKHPPCGNDGAVVVGDGGGIVPAAPAEPATGPVRAGTPRHAREAHRYLGGEPQQRRVRWGVEEADLGGRPERLEEARALVLAVGRARAARSVAARAPREAREAALPNPDLTRPARCDLELWRRAFHPRVARRRGGIPVVRCPSAIRGGEIPHRLEQWGFLVHRRIGDALIGHQRSAAPPLVLRAGLFMLGAWRTPRRTLAGSRGDSSGGATGDKAQRREAGDCVTHRALTHGNEPLDSTRRTPRAWHS